MRNLTYLTNALHAGRTTMECCGATIQQCRSVRMGLTTVADYVVMHNDTNHYTSVRMAAVPTPVQVVVDLDTADFWAVLNAINLDDDSVCAFTDDVVAQRGDLFACR